MEFKVEKKKLEDDFKKQKLQILKKERENP